ncbi:MAG: hypothetical protein ACD_75C01367G0007 [uncultured bacterium]|nr:MAG: hypothetical protein ACD_75C01367G0007 [uncultured bacterium]
MIQITTLNRRVDCGKWPCHIGFDMNDKSGSGGGGRMLAFDIRGNYLCKNRMLKPYSRAIFFFGIGETKMFKL